MALQSESAAFRGDAFSLRSTPGQHLAALRSPTAAIEQPGIQLGAPGDQKTSGRTRNMTAKEKVMEHAPRWSEAQAERALLAAEGTRSAEQNGATGHAALMERAAALRARQPEVVDAAALVREGRGELEHRAS
jgi:hypothetical protein